MAEGAIQKKDVIYFARTDFRNANRLFGFKRKDRRQHTYIIGKSGTGKTSLINNMIIQDISNGEGVCVVDPHGELVEGLIDKIPRERMKDVVYFNPADDNYHLGFNVLELPNPKYKHLVASGLMAIFTKIWANVWSARMEYIMNNAILALLETPGSTLLGLTRILVDKDYRQQVLANVKDPVVKAFWMNEFEGWRDQFRNEAIAPLQNKIGQFLSTSMIRNVVGQRKSTIDIFDIMNTKKIFLVNVSKGRIGEDNSSLLGAMLITKIQLSAMERVRIPEEEREDFYLYVDEFQNFATDSFAGILSEARKYRLNLVLAHQYVGQLVTDVSTKVRDAVFGNVGTMIMFRVGAADAEFLENEFSPEMTIEDMVNLPNYSIYLKVLCDGVASRPFSASTLPPFKVSSDCATPEEIIDMSRKMYARSTTVVEEDIKRWSESMGSDDDNVSQTKEAGYKNKKKPSENNSGQGKFPAVCDSCKKEARVHFKPTPGKPIFCDDCFSKIKAGTMTLPQKQKTAEPKDTSALASIGIEFEEEEPQKIAPQKPQRSKRIFENEEPVVREKKEVKELSLTDLKNQPEKKKQKKLDTHPDITGLREAIQETLSKEEQEK